MYAMLNPNDIFAHKIEIVNWYFWLLRYSTKAFFLKERYMIPLSSCNIPAILNQSRSGSCHKHSVVGFTVVNLHMWADIF